MQLSGLQKASAQAIVNIFETGSIRGDYAEVTLLPGDTGQLTYGRSQTTLASGNLYLLITDYVGQAGAAYGAQLRPYLPQLEAQDSALNNDTAFRELLADAGEDPVMQQVQDSFFDQVYWEPAIRSADALGAKLALGAAIVYDSTVHGSWAHVRDLTRQKFGELSAVGEKSWMADYVKTRRNWLATYPNPLLHKTVYRMDAFLALIDAHNWDLRLPVAVRGLTITGDALADVTPVKAPAEAGPKRLLSLKSPPMTGADVDWLQQRLVQAGIHVAASGAFDAQTQAAVRAFQEDHDLKADGMVGPITRSALEDLAVKAPATSPAANAPMPSVAVAASPVAAATKAAPAAAPVSTPIASNAVADIKQHVTSEVQAGVAAIQQTVQTEHQQLAQTIATGKAPLPAPAKRVQVKQPATLQRTLSSGRPMAAAGISAIILAISQLRDALVWIVGAPSATPTSPPATGAPPPPLSIPGLPQWVEQAYTYLHAIAAATPGEWVYRLRAAGFVLLCYVIYRLIRRHFDVQKLQGEVAEAVQVGTEVSSALK